jgi:hypothetical protein
MQSDGSRSQDPFANLEVDLDRQPLRARYLVRDRGRREKRGGPNPKKGRRSIPKKADEEGGSPTPDRDIHLSKIIRIIQVDAYERKEIGETSQDGMKPFPRKADTDKRVPNMPRGRKTTWVIIQSVLQNMPTHVVQVLMKRAERRSS